MTTTTKRPFEVTSKRRKGFPSETQVKKGYRVVHGDKELTEKLGRNDLCPCQSRRLFQSLLPRQGEISMVPTAMTITAEPASGHVLGTNKPPGTGIKARFQD